MSVPWSSLLLLYIIAFICGNASSFSSGRKDTAKVVKSNIINDDVVLIHSHHLLDHKPDNMILSGKKYKLRGVACLGRPGVALCIGAKKDIVKFNNKLKGAMPQKKFASVDISSSSTNAVAILNEFVDGFEEVPIAKLRELLTAVDQEDKFFALLGIDSTSSSTSQNRNSNENNVGATRNDTNRKSTKKRRKKKG